ncbi:hypothetical protein [Roseateles chitinivorans]|uniref:hypothetical protein n=1 Tax=Roseateles chitinivorans TaxID=2917965 RepID=UPI003D666BBB
MFDVQGRVPVLPISGGLAMNDAAGLFVTSNTPQPAVSARLRARQAAQLVQARKALRVKELAAAIEAMQDARQALPLRMDQVLAAEAAQAECEAAILGIQQQVTATLGAAGTELAARQAASNRAQDALDDAIGSLRRSEERMSKRSPGLSEHAVALARATGAYREAQAAALARRDAARDTEMRLRDAMVALSRIARMHSLALASLGSAAGTALEHARAALSEHRRAVAASARVVEDIGHTDAAHDAFTAQQTRHARSVQAHADAMAAISPGARLQWQAQDCGAAIAVQRVELRRRAGEVDAEHIVVVMRRNDLMRHQGAEAAAVQNRSARRGAAANADQRAETSARHFEDQREAADVAAATIEQAIHRLREVLTDLPPRT